MKKIKVVLNAIAILGAIGGAFASRYCKTCEDQVQYIPIHNTYQQAGEFGTDYNCAYSGQACTYYSDSASNPAVLVPCREGIYTPAN